MFELGCSLLALCFIVVGVALVLCLDDVVLIEFRRNGKKIVKYKGDTYRLVKIKHEVKPC